MSSHRLSIGHSLNLRMVDFRLCTIFVLCTSHLPAVIAPAPYPTCSAENLPNAVKEYLQKLSEEFTVTKGYTMVTNPAPSVWGCYKANILDDNILEDCGGTGNPYVIKMEGSVNNVNADDPESKVMDIEFFILVEECGKGSSKELVKTFQGDIDCPSTNLRLEIYNFFHGVEWRGGDKMPIQIMQEDPNYIKEIEKLLKSYQPKAVDIKLLETYYSKKNEETLVASILSFMLNGKKEFALVKIDPIFANANPFLWYNSISWPQFMEFRLPEFKTGRNESSDGLIDMQVRMIHNNCLPTLSFQLLHYGTLEHSNDESTVEVFLFEINLGEVKIGSAPSTTEDIIGPDSPGPADGSLRHFYATRHKYNGKFLSLEIGQYTRSYMEAYASLHDIGLEAMVWIKCKSMRKTGDLELLQAVEKEQNNIVEALKCSKHLNQGSNEQTFLPQLHRNISKPTQICYGLLQTSSNGTMKTYVFLHKSKEMHFAVLFDASYKEGKPSIKLRSVKHICRSLDTLLKTLKFSFLHPTWEDTDSILDWHYDLPKDNTMSMKEWTTLEQSDRSAFPEKSMLGRLRQVYNYKDFARFQLLMSNTAFGLLKLKCSVKIEFMIFNVKFKHETLKMKINDFILLTLRPSKDPNHNSITLEKFIVNSPGEAMDKAGKIAYKHLLHHATITQT